MSICQTCGKEFHDRYSSKTCSRCREYIQFKNDLSYLIEKIDYAQKTYNLNFEQATDAVKLYILEDSLYKIYDSIDDVRNSISNLY